MPRKIVLLDDPYRWSKLWYRLSLALRRRVRHRIFSAIERGDDAEALRLATGRFFVPSVGEFGEKPHVGAISAGRSGFGGAYKSRGGLC